MGTKMEKILNNWSLLFVNIAIIIIAELSDPFFIKNGIIHLIAIFFIILGISRIFVHYDAYDRYLRMLIRGGVAALLIFSASHLLEFFGYVYFKTYEDAIFVNVVNFYIISMLLVSIGAEYFLRTLKKDGVAVIAILGAGIVVFFLITILVFLKQIQVSLEPDELTIYIYAALVLGAIFLSINRLIKIKKHVSIMVGFVNYFIAAFILIAISALQYVFYDALKMAGISTFQIVYVSHFLFYGALTLMFLAFVRLANLGGIYKEAENYKNNLTG